MSFLADVIAEFLGDKVRLVDSARITAEAIRETLVRSGLLQRSGPGSASFFVTDATDRFTKVGARFMGHPVESAVRIERAEPSTFRPAGLIFPRPAINATTTPDPC